MRTAFILGAGFSKAITGQMPIASQMPITYEVGNALRKKLSGRMIARAPRPFAGDTFESWLSRIAESQPDLTDVQNADNHALYQLVTQTLHEIMLGCEARALANPVPAWLGTMLRILHVGKADVITFNYDTLLERAAVSSVCWDWEKNAKATTESFLQGVPPTVRAGTVAPEVDSLRLLKLHGSLDTYWVRGDVSGSTITRLPGAQHWDPTSKSDAGRERHAPGREPFLVPPASAKSAFYNNPITRQLWRDAADALHLADRVAVIGYSLPVTDLVTAGMISDALSGRDVRIDVVNPDAECVKERLASIGIDRKTVHSFAGDRCVPAYVAHLEREQSTHVGSTLVNAVSTHKIAVAMNPGMAWKAETLTRTEAGVELRLGPRTSLDLLDVPSQFGQWPNTITPRELRSRSSSGTPDITIRCGEQTVRAIDVRDWTDGWIILTPSSAIELDD
jgi:hypothetical protein